GSGNQNQLAWGEVWQGSVATIMECPLPEMPMPQAETEGMFQRNEGTFLAERRMKQDAEDS
ncbi:unnamed protein product, partial [Amoebophrya sp. A25]